MRRFSWQTQGSKRSALSLPLLPSPLVPLAFVFFTPAVIQPGGAIIKPVIFNSFYYGRLRVCAWAQENDGAAERWLHLVISSGDFKG